MIHLRHSTVRIGPAQGGSAYNGFNSGGGDNNCILWTVRCKIFFLGGVARRQRQPPPPPLCTGLQLDFYAFRYQSLIFMWDLPYRYDNNIVIEPSHHRLCRSLLAPAAAWMYMIFTVDLILIMECSIIINQWRNYLCPLWSLAFRFDTAFHDGIIW